MSLQRSFELNQGRLIGWNCESCKGYNDLLNEHCNFCKLHRPIALEHLAVDEFMKRGLPLMDDSEKYELHAKFFAEEKTLIKDLDPIQKLARYQELQEIAFNAKARINAHHWDQRDTEANLSKESRNWLLTPPPDETSTNAILTNKKVRKARMSDADKLLADLKELGVTNADGMVSKVVQKKTEKDYKEWQKRKEAAKGVWDPEAKPKDEEIKLGEFDKAIEKAKTEKKFDPASLNFLRKE